MEWLALFFSFKRFSQSGGYITELPPPSNINESPIGWHFFIFFLTFTNDTTINNLACLWFYKYSSISNLMKLYDFAKLMDENGYFSEFQFAFTLLSLSLRASCTFFPMGFNFPLMVCILYTGKVIF